MPPLIGSPAIVTEPLMAQRSVSLRLHPIIAIAAIRLLNIPLNGVLYVVLLLLCPLSHVLMMSGMRKHQHGSSREDSVIEGEIVSRPSDPAA